LPESPAPLSEQLLPLWPSAAATTPASAFNSLVYLAAITCGVPIASLSLAAEDWAHYEARVGLQLPQARHEHAFDQQATMIPGVYEVRNAATDAHFATNPIVVGEPHIRFYAGIALRAPDGQLLGTLSILDTVPRVLTPDQQETLRVLATQVISQLELRRQLQHAQDEHQRLQGLLRMANQADEALLPPGRAEIFVKQEQRLMRVPTLDLQYVEALGDYVNLHTLRERLTVYGTMKDLETKLPGHEFARVHRKYIVRLDRIVAIETDSVLLDGGPGAGRAPVRVPIGSSYKAGLLSRLTVI
jgi:DNA-binding LytR/AlgR family response regulator